VTRDSTHLRANMIANNMPQQLKWHAIGVFTTPTAFQSSLAAR
jgi:hypothetical protein